MVVLDASAYAADASAEACAPGDHTAVWSIQVRSSAGVSLSVPIAVDWTGSNYDGTMCFDAEHAAGLEISEVFFSVDGVFRNPANAGNYLFDAVVTPFAADGTPSTGTAYELRGWEDLPQILTATPIYNRSTKTLTVTGVSQIQGKPRAAVRVHVYVGQTQNAADFTDVGYTATGAGGRYTFTKKLATAPKFMVSGVNHYYWLICRGKASTEPGGCTSETLDGRDSYLTKVVVRSK